MKKVAMLAMLAMLAFLVSLTTFAGGTAYAKNDLEVDNADLDCIDEEGSQLFCSIGAAIEDALPGDKIEVNSGPYNENVVISKAGIRLEGDDVILDGTGLGGLAFLL